MEGQDIWRRTAGPSRKHQLMLRVTSSHPTRGKGKGKQNAKEAAEEFESKVEEINSVQIEFAGNASALPASEQSQWLQT